MTDNEKKVLFSVVIEVFLQEFPFLRRYIEVSWPVEKPKVRRIDQDLLSRSPRTISWVYYENRWLEFATGLRFLLIGNDGQELGKMKQWDAVMTKFSFRQPSTWVSALLGFKHVVKGETVSEALMRLEDLDQVAYILEIESCFERGELKHSARIHKVPSGKKLSEIVNLPTAQRLSALESQVRQMARKSLENELAGIDKMR